MRSQNDLPFTTPEGGNTGDNVATQIDRLGHITHGPKNEFYNGFTSDEWGGDFGLRKADVTTIPPIVARGVLVDVAGFKNMEALPSSYEITVADVEGALKAQNVDVTRARSFCCAREPRATGARTAATTPRSASTTRRASA